MGPSKDDCIRVLHICMQKITDQMISLWASAVLHVKE